MSEQPLKGFGDKPLSMSDLRKLRSDTNKPKLEIVPTSPPETENKQPSAGSQPSAPSAGTPPRAVSAPSAGRQTSISPDKDFGKVSNSIVREISRGIFTGKSKQLYDYLYSVTRSAMKPARMVRISKAELMRESNIKSTHTFYNNVRHLELIGLIEVTRIDGEHGGNSYEVFTPEESKGNLVQLAHLEQLAQADHPEQKLPVVVSAESGITALGLKPINTGASSVSKTSLKTYKESDDEKNEIFSDFIENFEAAAKKITGKNLSKYEKGKWGQLAELLISELEIAAGRAAQVSSIPAFLTEILRRRLFVGRELERNEKPPARNRSAAGETNSANNGIESLTELEKERLIGDLSELKSFCRTKEQFEAEYKKWYSEEEWSWIMSRLQQ